MASNPDVAPETQGAGPRQHPWWLSRCLWLGLILSLGFLVLAFVDIDFGEMAAALRSANLGWVALAGLTVMASAVAKGWRWHLLLYPVPSASSRPPAAQRIGRPRLINIWMAGTGVNLALPVPRAGDLLRVYLAGEAGQASKSLVLGTIAAEKLLDMVMLALCFLGLLLFVAMPQELAQRQGSTVGAAVALTAAVALLLWQRERIVALASRLLRHIPHGQRAAHSLERGLAGLTALRQPGRLLGLAALTVGIWFVSALTNYLIFLALDMPPSWVQSVFVLVVLQIGVAVPSTPGKIGLFQVLCRWALGVFGVAEALGLAYGVLLYVAAPLLLMVLGAVALVIEGWRIGRLPAELDLALFRRSGP